MLLRESVIDLGPGMVLAGRYQIRRVLGKGATGVVLEADDRVSRSLVALKVFKREIASDERWQEIVGSELRHARLLQHPNVCRVFDASEADGYRFLSMEYANGGSLRQRLRDGAADRTEEERVAEGRAVVSGLGAIHAAGIIHRDVKPDNVLRMEDGRLVLTDFGLAVAPGQTTFVSGYSGAVGTPSYMAPEVALGGDATMASDVFSLGVILHEIFFDRRPDWDTTKRGRFLKSPLKPDSTRLQKAMARVCAACLEELAPRRLQNAGEVKKHFERAVLGRTGTLLEVVRTSRWGLLVGLAVVSALTGGVVYLLQGADGPVQAEITGTPVDWQANAKLVARKEGRVRCITVGPELNTVRVILAAPAAAEVINLADGSSQPWPVAPELFAHGCPQWSDDGRTVAFLGGPRFADIMVSTHPDGSAARRLTEGYAPRWLPGGRELVFAHGRQRVGVTDMNGFAQILPDGAQPGESLVEFGVSGDGSRLAVLYRQVLSDRSAVVLYTFPGWKQEARIEVSGKLSRVLFGRDRELFAIMEESSGHTLALITRDGDVVRRGKLADTRLSHFLFLGAGPVAVTQRHTVTALVRTPAEEEREVLVAPALGRISTDSTGEHTVMERQLEDGRWIITGYDLHADRVVRLTDGPLDREPLLLPGSRELVFVQGAARKRVRACSLRAPSQCRTFLELTEPAAYLLGVSPDGKQLAHAWLQGAQYRLRIAGPGGETRDLGPLTTPCRLRWPSGERLWVFERAAQGEAWVEMNPATGVATGRREPAGELDAELCPNPTQAQGRGVLRLVPRSVTSLYQLSRAP